MTFKQDAATANAMKAHLVDKLAMGDEKAIKAQRRAMQFTVCLGIIAIGGYCGIRYRSRSKASNG